MPLSTPAPFNPDRPDRVQASLRVLLADRPDVLIVDQLQEAGLALILAATDKTRLLIVDGGLPDNAAVVCVRIVKGCWPWIRCLALVDTLEQQVALRDAGADRILRRGFTTTELFDSLAGLLSRAPPAAADPALEPPALG